MKTLKEFLNEASVKTGEAYAKKYWAPYEGGWSSLLKKIKNPPKPNWIKNSLDAIDWAYPGSANDIRVWLNTKHGYKL